MIYFILFFILLVCIYAFDYRKHSSGRMVAYILVCLFFIVIVGLRYRIGGDSIGYEREFRNIPTLGELSGFKFSSIRWEPGFVIFMSLAKSISSDFTFFQFLHAIAVNGILFWFIYKNTRNIFIGATIYYVASYLNFNTEILRESLAVCCFLLAWPAFREGRWYFYYPIALLGCSFHISALSTLVLPIFALPGIRGLFKLGYRTIFISVAVFLFCLFIQRKFFAIIQMVSDNDTITGRAQEYAKNSYGGMVLNVFGMLEQVIKAILLPALALWYVRLRNRMESGCVVDKRLRRLEVIIVTGIYYSVATLVIFIFQRFNNYILMFDYVVIASCFFTTARLRSRKRIRLSGVSWAAAFLVVIGLNFNGYFVSTYGSQTNKRYMLYYPYASRLDPKDDPNREEIIRYGVHIK